MKTWLICYKDKITKVNSTMTVKADSKLRAMMEMPAKSKLIGITEFKEDMFRVPYKYLTG